MSMPMQHGLPLTALYPCLPDIAAGVLQLKDQAGFKDEHLCWGQVNDMALFDKIVNLPKKDKKLGEMNE